MATYGGVQSLAPLALTATRSTNGTTSVKLLLGNEKITAQGTINITTSASVAIDLLFGGETFYRVDVSTTQILNIPTFVIGGAATLELRTTGTTYNVVVDIAGVSEFV